MSSFAMTVPYMRTSPLHMPRRDLVLGGADSLFLRVTVVDSDNPSAQALEITAGLGTPAALFTVWPDAPGQYFWDYGYALPVNGQILWSGAGTVSDAIGAFDFFFPSGTMMNWPRRCSWCLQLNYDTQGAEVLMAGKLHIRRMGGAYAFNAGGLMTDDYALIHTTTANEQVLT